MPIGGALLQLRLLEQALHEKPDAVEDNSGAERIEHLVVQLTRVVLDYHNDKAPNVCTEKDNLLLRLNCLFHCFTVGVIRQF